MQATKPALAFTGEPLAYWRGEVALGCGGCARRAGVIGRGRWRGCAMDVDGNDNTPEWGYCQKCNEPAIPCYLPGNIPSDEPDDLLCVDHCTDEGYCWGCGNFCAGLESFDFNPRGLCSDCRDDPDLTGEDNFDEGDFWIDPFEQDLGASEAKQ